LDHSEIVHPAVMKHLKAARPDTVPPIAEVVEDHVCADGKCKTD
jgi:hypothetical protein